MDIAFWREIQKCWRITTSNEDKKLIQEIATAVALDWGTVTITNSYSRNPLDDFEDEDDDEDD